MRHLIICFLLIAIMNQLESQSIAVLLELAEERNLTLKALEQSYQAARERGAQVSQRPDPIINLGVFALPIETRLGVQRARIGVMQTFPNNRMLIAKEVALNMMAKAEGQNGMIEQLTINIQIKEAYFEIYRLEQQQSIIRKHIQLLETMHQVKLSEVESGKGSMADALKIDLKRVALANQLAILAQEKSKPISVINQLLDRRLDTPIKIVDTLTFALIPYKMRGIVDAIQYEHPLMRRYSFQKEVARQNLSVNEFNQKPSFSVGIDYLMMDKLDNFEFEKNGRDAVIPKANVTIPFLKTKYAARQREQELTIESLTMQQQNVQSQFMEAIHQAFVDYETARLKFDLYQSQIQTTKNMIQTLETEYSAVGTDFDEIIQRQINLVTYDLLVLEEIVKSHIIKAKIERYLPFD